MQEKYIVSSLYSKEDEIKRTKISEKPSLLKFVINVDPRLISEQREYTTHLLGGSPLISFKVPFLSSGFIPDIFESC